MQIKPANKVIYTVLTVICLYMPELISAQTDSVTITEVMFKPLYSGVDTTEFFEIYNYGSQAVDLANWWVRDNLSVDTLKSTGSGTVLNAGQFAVIFQQNYNVVTGFYKDIVPLGALQLRVHSGAIGNGLGNTVDSLRIFNTDSVIISRYTWNVASGHPAGTSHEKLTLNNDNSSSNWTNSYFLNGTPGNYPELDLSIKEHRLIFVPTAPPTNATVSITATINNMALRGADSFKVKFYEDINKNYSPDDGEELDSVSHLTALNFADSAMVSVNSETLSSGTHIFIAKLLNITPNTDTSLANNSVIDSVSTVPAMDLSVSTSFLTFTPSNPKVGDNLQVSSRIKNTGFTATTDFTVKFYEDINRNVSPDANEFIDSVNFTGTLNTNDSINASITVNSITFGWHSYLAKIIPLSVLPLVDEVSSNDQRMDSVHVTIPDSITITEVMFKPISGEDFDEFIEVHNYSNQPIDLLNWRVRDNSSLDTLKNAGSGTILNPSQFAVIFHQSYDLVNGLYKDIFPVGALPLKVHSGLIGNGLGNSADSVKLVNSIGDTISRYAWSVPSSFTSGISREKKYLSNENAPSNWANSIYINGTPGLVNSVTPKQLDLSILPHDITFSPAYPVSGQMFSISARLYNIGEMPSGSFSVNIYRYVDQDSILLSSFNSTGLAPGDFVVIAASDTSVVEEQQILIRIIYPLDENLQNNAALKEIVLGTNRFSVVVNEINYLPSSASTEWIELYNRSTDSVNLKKWKWSDEANFNSPKSITTSNYWLKSDGYVLLVKDSVLFNNFYANVPTEKFYMNTNFSSLNNSGDLIVLFDSLDIPIDSLFYEPSWGGGADISLERVIADSSSTIPSNWRSSEAYQQATPGSLNSQTPVAFDIAVRQNDISFSPPHPAVNQPVTITAVVRNKGLQAINSYFTVKVFYDEDANQVPALSELIDSITFNSLNVGDSLAVAVNWTVPFILSKRNFQLAESRYIIVLLEYNGDQRIENNLTIRELKIGIRDQSVLINEILFEPDTSQVEFVEIYNFSNTALNLQNWTISDASSSKVIDALPQFISTQHFRVLTGDSAFFQHFPNVSDSLVIVIPSMPSLNNTDDKVVLKDDVGNVVDSLHYYSNWGGRNGKSLERRSFTSNTNDPASWVSSLSATGSTPAAANSILQAHAYLRNSVLINEIMYSPFSGEPEYIEVYNPADSGINLLNWSLLVGSEKTIIVSDHFILPSKDYAVLAQNTSFSNRFDIPHSKILLTESGLPTLSNSGNTILLQDLVANTIDSVNYSPNWGGGEGISIERIRSDGDANVAGNWGSCVFIEGGTPAAINSNIAGSLRKKINITASPNPFLVDQGQQTKITIDIPVAQARMTVKIYDNQGRLINTLLNNSLTGSHREIEWDGKDRGRKIARMGIYIIYVEVIDDISGFNKSAKQTVVLGRRL